MYTKKGGAYSFFFLAAIEEQPDLLMATRATQDAAHQENMGLLGRDVKTWSEFRQYVKDVEAWIIKQPAWVCLSKTENLISDHQSYESPVCFSDFCLYYHHRF